MKKIFAAILIFFTINCYSQKVSDILENGIVVRAKGGIYLQLKKNEILFETETSSGNFDPLKNEAFFLLKGRGANIFISPPLNPLNYSTSIETTFEPDAINAAAGDALSSIISGISSIQKLIDGDKSNNFKIARITQKDGKNRAPASETDPLIKCQTELEDIKKDFDDLAQLFKSDNRSELEKVFNDLKLLDFEDKTLTQNGIDKAKKDRTPIESHFNAIKDKLKSTGDDIDLYKECAPSPVESFIYVYVLGKMIEDAQLIHKTFTTRLKNLDNAIASVEKTYNNSGGDGRNWYILLERVSMQDEKIASTKVKINIDGYTLNDSKEIIRATANEVVSTTLKFRKFQRFVPEVSAGIAYTQLRFPKFSTATDPATNKLRVVEAGEEKFKQMNFTSMINFNYYLPNSPLHPFWQIGMGANADYPAFFTGIGLRLNIALKRLAVSAGCAGTWIKMPQTLKVDDEVKDDATLEKDLKHEFSFPLKPYVGIQLNF